MPSFAPISRDVLGCLVAGYEKGGTTLVKDLVRHACRLRGCFEGGLLLADSPATGLPEPYASSLLQSWALPATFFDEYRRCRTFEEGYRLLRDRSDHVLHKHRPLIDKTPRYMMQLDDVLRRAPTTPVIVAIRDPALVAGSWVRLGQTPAAAAAAIRASTEGLARVAASGEGADRVYVMQVADLAADTQATLDAAVGWLGFPPRPHDPTMRVGTPEASGRHEPGIAADRDASSRTIDPAIQAAIDDALLAEGSVIPWVRGLRTGPLLAATSP
jgi:hypothetical protein